MKHTQELKGEELQIVLAVARGEKEPSLLIKNVKVLDLVNGEIYQTHIAFAGKIIAGVGMDYEATHVIDGEGLFAVPGFIDAHLHIESSLMNPFEFEAATLPLGTTSAICDPHEITNVLGVNGFEWFLRCSEMMRMNLFVQVSSCVPALPGKETNQGPFTLEQMKKYKSHSHVLGLAEMMNFPGVINGDQEVIDKIEFFQDGHLDGHSPLLSGKALNAYRVAGIENCHETVTKEEAREKLQKGMAVILREGSVAKNLMNLAPIVSEFNSTQCLLCTDDRNPFEIKHEGHINYMVRKLIQEKKMPAHLAYRLSSYSSAKHFNLKRLGLIAPGHQADLILLSDLNQVKIEKVFCQGQPVDKDELRKNISQKLKISKVPQGNSIIRKKTSAELFSLPLTDGKYNVIEIIPNEIITNHLELTYQGNRFLERNDVMQIIVLERYGHERTPAFGLICGLGQLDGAIAASVAHDSHNLIVIGNNTEDMSLVINTLIEQGGGFCIAKRQRILANLALPIAGLISLESSEFIATQLASLKQAQLEVGITLHEPFLQMAFVALPVIPSLKITDQGLFDVKTFQFVNLKI